MLFWKNLKPELKNEIIGIILFGFSILIAIGLWLESKAVVPGAEIGTFGAFFIRVLNGIAGEGKYILPVILVIMAVRLMIERKIETTGSGRWLGFIIGFLMILGIIHIPYASTGNFINVIQTAVYEGIGGGLLGALISVITLAVFGTIGSYVVFSVGLVISFLLITNIHLFDLFSRIYNLAQQFFLNLAVEIKEYIFNENKELEDDIYYDKEESLENVKSKKNKEDRHSEVENPLVKASKIKTEEKEKTEEEMKDSVKDKKPSEYLDTEDFKLPPINLLQRETNSKTSGMNRDVSEKIKLLEETLESFGIEGKVSQVSCGPVITRYEFQPKAGTKVSKIVNLANDISLNLAAPDVRIEAPIPGKAAIGIEVPNKEISLVHFRELLESREFQNSKAPLTLAIGKDIAGQAIVADLTKMPHLLIAGATGSGKSVCMNTLICSLLYKCTPKELKIMIIDPKMVELINFNGIPHLITPVVTDTKKAATALRWMVNEMENRYELFSETGVKDITRYNSLKLKDETSGQIKQLPYLAVFIDELADLMMVAPADVEDAVCRLAQMARAAGIHLVVATQRPSVDVITGLIKANIPSRIAFAVSSQTDSRTILDTGGADKLLGQGDMLLDLVGLSKPIRVQGTYISDKEVENIVNFLKEQGKPEYEETINEKTFKEDRRMINEDELLPEAVRILLESNQASISLLQRRLRIGYTRAARLVDLMETKGIIGGYEGSKPRKILIDWEEYKRMFGKM